MVAQAEAEARAIAEQAEEQSQAMVADSTQKGEEEGRQSAAASLELAEKVNQQMGVGLDKEALEAAVAATKGVVALELKHRPRAIVDVVKRALGNAKHQKEIFVRVNPKDAVVLRENKRELLDVLSRARDVDIREDPTMQQGGCLVETEIGMVDADLNTQIDRLGRMLMGRGGG
jgi:type III secretion protein L